MQNPTLCEPGMKYFIRGSLKECRKFRDKHTTLLFNVAVACLFVLLLGGFLWYNYKGKLTPEEVLEKQKETHHYLVSKLQQYSAIKQKKSDTMITDLPVWNESHI